MKLLIAGAGGHGRVVADSALASGMYSHVAFLDDRYPNIDMVEGWSVVGKLNDFPQVRSEYENFIVAIGDAKLRLAVLNKAQKEGFKCPPVVHPAAIVSKYATLGIGTAVIAGAVINIGAKIGMGCIINTAATVDHDCIIEDGVHVCPGAHLAGEVLLGKHTWFGIGAVAKHGVRVGSDVTIGAGTVVVKNISNGLTVIGNPARLLIK